MNINHVNPAAGTTGPEGNIGQAVARPVLKTEPVQAPVMPEKQDIGMTIEEAREMAETLNETMSDLGTNLGFNVLEDMNNQVIVEITNRQTDELIRQIPSEEMLKIMEKMEELSGLIFDSTI